MLGDRARSFRISTFDTIKALIKSRELRVSEHGWDELESDDISIRHLLETIDQAELIEDYPEFGKGPSILLFQRDRMGNPIHVVWGIPKGHAVRPYW